MGPKRKWERGGAILAADPKPPSSVSDCGAHLSLTSFYLLIYVLLAVTLAYASFSDVGTIWDGAYSIYTVAQKGSPDTPPHRYTSLLFAAPILLSSRITHSERILSAALSLPYWIVPLGCCALALILLRKHSSEARIIAVTAILGISLPGQIMFFAETVHLGQIFPVLVIIAVCPLTAGRGILLSLLVLLCALHHPGSALPLIVIWIVLAFKLLLYRKERTRIGLALLAFMTTFAAFGVWRMLFDLSAYEQSQRSWQMTLLHYNVALRGIPELLVLILYGAMLALAVLRVAPLMFGIRPPAFVRWSAVACLLLAAPLMFYWAANAANWMHADAYRRFALVLVLPVIVPLGACLLADQREPPGRDGRSFEVLAVGLVVITYAGCLTIQSTIYRQLQLRLQEQIANSTEPILYGDSLRWASATALNIWALPYDSLLLQDTGPHTVATFAAPEEVVYDTASHLLYFGKFPVLNVAAQGPFMLRTVRPLPERAQRATLLKDISRYSAEQWPDGTPFYWADRTLTFVYRVESGTASSGRVTFRYLSQTPARHARLIVRNRRDVLQQEIDMSDAYKAYDRPLEFVSKTFRVSPGEYSVELSTSDPSVVAGPNDSRRISFMVIGPQLRLEK